MMQENYNGILLQKIKRLEIQLLVLLEILESKTVSI